jgi:hypothetical protein
MANRVDPGLKVIKTEHGNQSQISSIWLAEMATSFITLGTDQTVNTDLGLHWSKTSGVPSCLDVNICKSVGRALALLARVPGSSPGLAAQVFLPCGTRVSWVATTAHSSYLKVTDNYTPREK